MGRLSRSISLIKSSWAVLAHDKELAVLPAISGIASAVAIAPFLAGAFVSGADVSDDGVSFSVLGYVLMFVGYLVAAYVTIFFQSALVLAANERLSGGDPTLGSALSAASSNAGRILPWAIISATVSIVLRSLQERSGFVGRLLLGAVGMAWTVVTFLVLPILVIEGTGVKEAVTRSGSAFKRTWGENVVGNAGVGLIGVIGMLVGVVVAGPIVALGVVNDVAAVVVGGIALFVVWAIVVSVVTAALTGIFQTALYRFAVLGEEPSGFSHDQIAGAFGPRTKRFG